MSSTNTVNSIVVFFLFVIALGIWAILSFSQKRTRKLQNICDNRPGVVFPINFLSPRHRLVYTVACAAQSSLWLELLFISWSIDTIGNKWISLLVKAIFLVIFSFVVVMLTYPVLACVEAPIPILGYFLGFLYSIVYLISRLYIIFSSYTTEDFSNYTKSQKALLIGSTIGQLLPEVVCMIIVILWYTYKAIKECARIVKCGEYWKMAIFEQPVSLNNFNYVKLLLHNGISPTSKRLSFFYSKIQLPLPLLIVTAVSAVIIFQLLVFTVTTFPYISGEFSNILSELNQDSALSFLDDIVEILNILTAVLVIAPILSTILTVSLVCHFLYVVRKETILIRKGKSQFSSSIKKIKFPSIKLTSSVHYCGFQLASIITGWMLYSIIFFIVGTFFLAVHVAPGTFGYILYFLFITVLLVVAALVIEGLMCKYIFLTKESSQQNTIVINNRRIFNTFTYIVLLYNVATGLFTSTIRLISSFLLTLLLKPRLDRVVFINPFEILDTGHSMYKSFMITESLLHNPTVHVFVNLIAENSLNDGKKNTTQYKPGYRYSKKARNRWFVAYTLLNNPSLLDKDAQERIQTIATYEDTENSIDTSTHDEPKVMYNSADDITFEQED